MRLPPSPEAVALIHGIWRAGAVLLPLNPAWPDAEVERAVLAVGGTEMIVERREQVEGWVSAQAGASEQDPGSPEILDGDLAALVLTSGSTGAPRPVGISHGNLDASAAGVIERLGLRARNRWLTSLSPAHIGGLALIHRAAVVGCTLVTRPRFDAVELARLIDTGEISHASLVPVMLKRLIDQRGDRPCPASLECLLVGGAAVPQSILEQALALDYPIALTYGLTETTSQVATANPSQVSRKPGTVGRPLSGVELRIEPTDSSDRGEIVVRGPTVGRGSPDVQDGWLHTRDLGYLDGDGDLWISGRSSDRIVTGGVTVEPAEVEAVLSVHPSAGEVAVVGVPDSDWGERIIAVVVPADPERPPTLQDLLEFTRGRLAPPKRPRELKILSILPRTPNGKLDRARLRALCS